MSIQIIGKKLIFSPSADIAKISVNESNISVTYKNDRGSRVMLVQQDIHEVIIKDNANYPIILHDASFGNVKHSNTSYKIGENTKVEIIYDLEKTKFNQDDLSLLMQSGKIKVTFENYMHDYFDRFIHTTLQDHKRLAYFHMRAQELALEHDHSILQEQALIENFEEIKNEYLKTELDDYGDLSITVKGLEDSVKLLVNKAFYNGETKYASQYFKTYLETYKKLVKNKELILDNSISPPVTIHYPLTEHQWSLDTESDKLSLEIERFPDNQMIPSTRSQLKSKVTRLLTEIEAYQQGKATKISPEFHYSAQKREFAFVIEKFHSKPATKLPKSVSLEQLPIGQKIHFIQRKGTYFKVEADPFFNLHDLYLNTYPSEEINVTVELPKDYQNLPLLKVEFDKTLVLDEEFKPTEHKFPIKLKDIYIKEKVRFDEFKYARQYMSGLPREAVMTYQQDKQGKIIISSKYQQPRTVLRRIRLTLNAPEGYDVSKDPREVITRYNGNHLRGPVQVVKHKVCEIFGSKP